MSPKRRVRTSPEIQQRANQLRRTMTPGERTLWQHLRRKQIHGLKFRRQHPLGPFILDFYCGRHRLVVEVDGEIHCGQRKEDQARTARLEAYGYRVLRFPNHQVLNQLETVLRKIGQACGIDEKAPPHR